ncbi:MAG: Thiol-disulfide oxidoreductase ResA [Desulfovibrio sp.]
MKRNILKVCAALGLVLTLCVSAPAAAPEFEVLTYPGLQTLVAENKGKVVVVNFFATWCPPCREEIPGLINIRKHFGANKLLLIGASIDEDDNALRAYMKKTKFNYPVMKGGDDLVRAAQVRGIPHLLVFDAQGGVAANEGGYVPEETLRTFLQSLMEAK